MPFTHNLDPVLFHLGDFQIRYYGLAWVFGFLLVYYILNKHKEKLNISKETLENYLLYLILGVIIGARIFHVIFSDLTYYLDNPLKIFFLWNGGLAFHGGLTGALLVNYYFVRKNNISWKKFGDILVIPIAFALALGRIANFVNGEVVGTVTDASWCVYFQGFDGCRHPSQIYESLANFSIFGILLFLNKKERKEGFIFWMFILLMGLARFFISFVRDDPRFLWLTDGQYFGLIMIFVGAYTLFKSYSKRL